jgi:hypothetical protein
MNQCIFDGQPVNWGLVGIDQMSFGSDKWGVASISYHLVLDRDYVISEFEEYYRDFLDRESDADPDEDPMSEETLELHALGYPSLSTLYDVHPELFCRLIMKLLANPFMGYMFNTVGPYDHKYILQTIVSMDVVDGALAAKGFGLLNPLYRKNE